jgi:predicted RNase H-like nuclease
MVKRAFGLDLAWTDGNRTGACVLDESGRVIDERLLLSDDEIVAWVGEHLPAGAAAVITVDGPLRVPNDSGRRRCESELSSVYASRKAATHSSNRGLFERMYGRVRGEDLVERFAAMGFRLLEGHRPIIEVYPHPALIEVFGLPERLRYKSKRGFRVADRRQGLAVLQRLLATLADVEPPLQADLMTIDGNVRGRALKDVEDLLDARLCAWLALLWATHGSEAFAVYGDRESGHIAVPHPRP